MSLRWAPVEWSRPVELPSFWASVQPAAPGPLRAVHPVLWNTKAKGQGLDEKTSNGLFREVKTSPRIQPLLTLWHGDWQTLWTGLFSSNWRFGHWDTNSSNVRVVPVRAIVSTPVVIPGAAYRLRRDMRRNMRAKRIIVTLNNKTVLGNILGFESKRRNWSVDKVKSVKLQFLITSIQK